MKIGFVGLGNMGRPMARNLVDAGHQVTVYNRTRKRAVPLEEKGAIVADSPAAAAEGAEFLITMLSDDEAVEAVILDEEDGALDALEPGSVHVCMGTISVELSRGLAARHSLAGQGYVAAPVFGRPEAAEAGKLWIVAGGPSEEVERCRPLFDVLGQGVIEAGEEVARANVIKLAGNFLLSSAIEAMGEAFALVRKYGVDPADFLAIANGKVIRSPVYEGYGQLIVNEEYEPAGFKLKHGLKDTRLALAAADEVGAPLPFAGHMFDHYLSAVAYGWSEIDWAGLGRVCARHAGLDETSA